MHQPPLQPQRNIATIRQTLRSNLDLNRRAVEPLDNIGFGLRAEPHIGSPFMVYIGDINAGGQAVQGQEHVVTGNKMMMDSLSPSEAFSSAPKAYLLETAIGQRIRASG
jgi:hypothetical protein